MKIKVIAPVAAALYRLAAAHYHEWANHTTQAACEADWDAAVVEATARMDEAAIELAAQKYGRPGGIGLYPATSHTTGSGRLSWAVEPTQEGVGVLNLWVERPGPIGGYIVIESRYQWLPGQSFAVTDRFDIRPVVGCQLRHLTTWMMAAQHVAGCAEGVEYDTLLCYIENFLETPQEHAEFRGGEFAPFYSRIEAEILAEEKLAEAQVASV